MLQTAPSLGAVDETAELTGPFLPAGLPGDAFSLPADVLHRRNGFVVRTRATPGN